MYYVAPDGKVYDDGMGDHTRAYGVDPIGHRFSLEPHVVERLTARYYVDHPPAAVGGLSPERVAEIRSRFPIGDAIARLTSVVGIKPCAPCKRRQQALNQLGDRAARYFR